MNISEKIKSSLAAMEVVRKELNAIDEAQAELKSVRAAVDAVKAELEEIKAQLVRERAAAGHSPAVA